MFSSVPDAILTGSQGLLMLFFALAGLYFSWVMARANPDSATRWFFRCMAATIIVIVIAFISEVAYAAIYSFSHPIGMTMMPLITLVLGFLESLGWFAAACFLLRWASGRKRQAA